MEVVTLNQLDQRLVSFMQQLAIPLGLLLLQKAGLGIRPQICSLISFDIGSYNQVVDLCIGIRTTSVTGAHVFMKISAQHAK